MKFISSLYLTGRLFFLITIAVVVLALSFALPILLPIGKLLLFTVLFAVIADILLLYTPRQSIIGTRTLPERFSNGDNNKVILHIENLYRFPVSITILDEVPEQFQLRNFKLKEQLNAAEAKFITYELRPVKRGEYNFGALNIFSRGSIGLIERRFAFEKGKMVKVYPSYLQMRKYELMAIHNNLSELGIKKILKIGHTMEFEKIKNYVVGDDYRTVNWMATARRMDLMVNQFQDERSQNIYSIIDKGRLMKMPFDGLSLLDYSINSSLVLSNIAINKHDRAGLITFSDKVSQILPPDKGPGQMNRIMESLYHQRTFYLESNYEMLYAAVRSKINQRSLLMLYTNFESLSSAQRQLRYLKPLAKSHVLVVVFFVNTGLKSLLESEAKSIEGIYMKTIGEMFDSEKRRIVKELNLYNIHCVLTPPKGLTVQVINKYLEIKARSLI